MTDRIHPGDVVARRYRMVDLLHENEGGTFWRAYDQVLARNVAFHLIAADDPRADLLLDAARRSATVSDPRILRVLDADEVDGRVYVVNEWGNGRSLDLILIGAGTIPPRRAAWIVSEVADTLARGHVQGQAHGRLVPENVLIDHNGSVKLIGFAVDAALHGLPPGRRSADVTDLVAVLYAALTGRWAGVSRSTLPPAPQLAGHPLRPRKVKAGVPRQLDRLCEEVLNPLGHTAGTHARTVETALHVHDALVEFVGDPDAVAAVEAGEVALARAALSDTGASLLLGRDPEATVAAPAPVARTTPPAHGEDRPDPEATVAGRPELVDPEQLDPELRDPDWHRPRADKPPPPPRFEQPPDKPLFDPDPVRRPRHPEADEATGPGSHGSGPAAGSAAASSIRGIGGVETGRRSGRSTGSGVADPPTGAVAGERTGRGREYWPFAGTDGGGPDTTGSRADPEDVPGRTWLRLAGVVAVLVLVLTGFVVVRSLSGPGATATDPTSPSTSASAGRSPTVLEPRSATDYDPQGEDRQENPQEAASAVDGDPATAWTTVTYTQQLGPDGLKTGVGLLVDLGARRPVAQLSVRLVGAPTGVSLYLSSRPPSGDPTGTPVRSGTVDDDQITVSLTSPTRARYLLVWLTSLPPVRGGYQGGVAEVTIRS